MNLPQFQNFRIFHNSKLLGLVISLIFLTACKTVVLDEKRFLYPKANQIDTDFELSDYQFKQHMFTRTDGTTSYGAAVTKPGNELTILFFGGNKFTMADEGMKVINQLSQFNADVYLFDHRGYGQSSDEPTLRLLMQDAIENYDYVRKQVMGNLLLHGHSMGSFEAGWVAKQRDLDALVLESTITHVDDWVKDYLPRIIRPLVKFEVDEKLRIVNNLDTVMQSISPLLLIVGGRDKLTRQELSKTLYQAAKTPQKTLHVFDQANHRNVRSDPQFNLVYQQFIDMNLNKP